MDLYSALFVYLIPSFMPSTNNFGALQYVFFTDMIAKSPKVQNILKLNDIVFKTAFALDFVGKY